jgi:hypothetical protein
MKDVVLPIARAVDMLIQQDEPSEPSKKDGKGEILDRPDE